MLWRRSSAAGGGIVGVAAVSRVAAIALACAVTLYASPAAAWGELGHRVSALIAYERLTPVAKARIERLLQQGKDDAGEPDFVDSSVWADRLRFTEPEINSAAWHLADYPLNWTGSFASCPGPQRAIRSKVPTRIPAPDAGCLVSKLAESQRTLAERRPDPRALKFLMHLIADAHQPLHAATNADQGGECVKLIGSKGMADSNLHAYLDTTLVRSLGGSPERIAASLRAGIRPTDVAAWTGAGPAEGPDGWIAAWTRESHALALRIYASIPPGIGCRSVRALPPAAESEARRIVAMQLTKGGVRTAHVLNRLFDPNYAGPGSP